MNFRTIAILVLLVLLGAFTVLNWAAITAPTTLSIGFTHVQAPLGLIMLIVTTLLFILFLGYLVFQQAGVILETRRMSKELKTQRELADSAEASRFTELRSYISQELTTLSSRIELAEQALRDRIAESERSLSAFVAEVDDKLDRLHPPRPDA